MTLIVTDSQGRKYRPTGCFREPKVGEYVYCFDHKRVEWRGAVGGSLIDQWLVDEWCSNGHVEFLLHRIIVEPLPVEYEVTVRLSERDFEKYQSDSWRANTGSMLLHNAIAAGNYREVQP